MQQIYRMFPQVKNHTLAKKHNKSSFLEYNQLQQNDWSDF